MKYIYIYIYLSKKKEVNSRFSQLSNTHNLYYINDSLLYKK